MKFSKKNINKRNKKNTFKKKLVKNNKTRNKLKVKTKKLIKIKKYKFKGGNPEFNKLFVQIVNDIQEDNIDNIKSIIDQNPGLINYQMGNNKSTLLLQSCLLLKPDLIKLFIEKGANVNMESNETTPLCISAFNNCFQCVKILISNGANINGTDDVKKIPLMYALSNSHGLFSMNNNEEIPPQVKNNYIELIKFLITNGSKLNHKDDYGWSSLFYAIEYGSPIQLIDLLLQNGADVTLVSNIGNSALQLACKRRSLDVVKTLFNNSNIKDTINNADKIGVTPLIEATKRNNFEIVEFLLYNGADPSIKDKTGSTALKYATEYGIKLDYDLMNNKSNSKITYLAKNKEKNILIIKLLEEKRKAQIAAKLGQLGKQNNQKEIQKLQEESQNLEKQITTNAEIMNKIKESNADIMAQQLIEEEENQKIKVAAKKNKKSKDKDKFKEKVKDEVESLSNNPLIHKSETSHEEDIPIITNQQKPSELLENQYDHEYLKQLHEEANQRFDLDTQKALELSMESFNIQNEKDKEKELLDFWSLYFGNKQESLPKLKAIIPILMLEQNSYQLLISFIPAYSNKFINRNPFINNVISLLFLLIGIISNYINKNDNQVNLILKGGAAIQTVSSQLPNQSYESNDLDIIIINNKNLDDNSKVMENKMLAEKIGDLLKWLTSVEENGNIKYIISFDPNEDKTYPIYKIKIGNTSLIDLDYNILPSEILSLYKSDIYSKNFNIEPYGNFNGTFFCPTLINLIKEKMYYLISYGSIRGIRVHKNRAFFNFKIPKSLNYLINVYKIMVKFKGDNRDFYERIFSYFFNDYPNLEQKLTDPDDPAFKSRIRNDETLVPYTKPKLIKFLLDKINNNDR